MASVITVADQIGCGHGGVLKKVAGNSLLTVNSNAVVTAAMFAGDTVTGCLTPSSTPPPQNPCTLCTGVTATNSSVLTVGGVPVLTDPVHGGTNGNLPPAPPTDPNPPVNPQQKVGLMGAPGQAVLKA